MFYVMTSRDPHIPFLQWDHICTGTSYIKFYKAVSLGREKVGRVNFLLHAPLTRCADSTTSATSSSKGGRD